jgi:hypothetical protein
MDSVIATLKDTPVPTILVVAGIVFLLLSIAGQLAGRIAVPPERQRQAAILVNRFKHSEGRIVLPDATKDALQAMPSFQYAQ